eukprot:6530331-Pyramimonas_sp.AAC.1
MKETKEEKEKKKESRQRRRRERRKGRMKSRREMVERKKRNDLAKYEYFFGSSPDSRPSSGI